MKFCVSTNRERSTSTRATFATSTVGLAASILLRCLCFLTITSSIVLAQSSTQPVATRLYGDMTLEQDIPFHNAQVYHGISNAGCAQAVTLADNRSLTVVWQKQVNDGWGCGQCVEEWKLLPSTSAIPTRHILYRTTDHNVVAHQFLDQPKKMKEGLKVYPTCIGWAGVWHSATAEPGR